MLILNERLFAAHSIISHLETLKTEAGDIACKVEETDVVMAEVETVSQQYVPLAQSCSSMYFTMEALNQVGTSVYFFCVFLLLLLFRVHCHVFSVLYRNLSVPSWVRT